MGILPLLIVFELILGSWLVSLSPQQQIVQRGKQVLGITKIAQVEDGGQPETSSESQPQPPSETQSPPPSAVESPPPTAASDSEATTNGGGNQTPSSENSPATSNTSTAEFSSSTDSYNLIDQGNNAIAGPSGPENPQSGVGAVESSVSQTEAVLDPKRKMIS